MGATKDMRRSWVWILALSAWLNLSASQAQVTRFQVRDPLERNVVEVVSEGMLERTSMQSGAISGWMELDPNRVRDGVKGAMEMDARTFRTLSGPLEKNELIRDQFLGTADYPYITYKATRLVTASRPKLANQQPVILRVEGQLQIRDVTKPLTILIKATYYRDSELSRKRLAGNLLHISTSFDLDARSFNLAPEGMGFPRFLQVAVDAVGNDAPLPPILTLPSTTNGQKTDTKK